MKKPVLSLLFLILATTCMNAQTGNSIEATKADQTITKLFDAVAALDLKKMRDCATKDFMLVENGVVWNMDSLVNRLSLLKGDRYSRVNPLISFKQKSGEILPGLPTGTRPK